MYQFILFIHIFSAACIIALALVQQGKGASMGAAFGSGASQTVFGSKGSGSFLFRMTMSFILIFFITSLYLNHLAADANKQQKEAWLPTVPQHRTAPMSSQELLGKPPASQVKEENKAEKPEKAKKTAAEIPVRQEKH